MEMTWLIRGKEPDHVNTHYRRWIVFRELEGDLAGRFTSMMIAALHDANESTAESKLLIAFKSYFASKLDNTIKALDGSIETDPNLASIYPDKEPADWDTPLSIGTLDIKKARIAPYVARLALKYMEPDSDFFVWASRLADLTANKDWLFLDQSPDTRDYTFQAAVVCESTEACSTTSNIQFMIDEISTYGDTDFFCSGTDLSYPLYGGDCHLQRYWTALKYVIKYF